MPTRNIHTGHGARVKLISGAVKVARAVSTTYGPGGRTCILDRMAGMLVTKDGVTVAREVDLPDSVENQGCQILKGACTKVNDEVGDGTTTVAILASEMMRVGHKMISAGVVPGDIVRGMNLAKDNVIDFITGLATPVSSQADLERVAMLASNGDAEIASNMAEACMAVGKDGTITIEDGVGLEVVLEFQEGMEIEQGPCSPLFLGDKPERVVNTPLVAVIHGRLRSLADVQDLMEVASQWPDNELVVFCLTAEAEALAVMAVNNSKEVMKCVAIGAPGVQFRKLEYLEDLAAMSGATLVDPNSGLDHRKWNPEWFGSLNQVTIRQKSTVMTSLPEAGDAIAERVKVLRSMGSTCVSDYDRDRLKERLAKLSSGIAIMKIGGATEVSMKERRARVEDAMGSVRAALQSGIVPGGGVSYAMASSNMKKSDDFGWDIVKTALLKPLEIIANNAGEEGKVVVNHIVESDIKNYGWDATTLEYRNVYEDPMIVDPLQVAIAVITAAVSVATTLLTIETVITTDGDK